MPSIDLREMVRFLLSGGVATGGNLAAVWLVRPFTSFTVALLVGIAVGMTLSFLLSKLFAFQSRDWSATKGEAGRFLIVYGLGLVFYWLAAMGGRVVFNMMGVPMLIAESLAILGGAGVMVVTSYFGHRFFTYRQTTGSVGG